MPSTGGPTTSRSAPSARPPSRERPMSFAGNSVKTPVMAAVHGLRQIAFNTIGDKVLKPLVEYAPPDVSQVAGSAGKQAQQAAGAARSAAGSAARQATDTARSA